MSPLVGVLVLILLGLLGSRFAFDPARAPLGPRLLLTTGTHFLLLGLLLGPVLGLLTVGVMGQLQALMALGLGWIGLLFGLQLDRQELGQFPPAYFLFALVQAAATFVLFAAAAWWAFRFVGRAGPGVEVAVLTAAATAAVSTPAGIALISSAFRVQGPLTRFLFYVASVDAVIGIVALQVTYAIHHPSTAVNVAGFGWGVWLAIATAAPIVFGVFFLWVTRPKPERDELTLFLLGLVVFEAGTALYLGLSPLFVSMLTGAFIANLSPLRRRVYSVLQTWEKPIYVVLLILAGALLGATPLVVLPLAAGYILLRGMTKYLAARTARRWVPLPLRTPAATGLGLVPQGGISLAMALSAALTYGAMAGPEGDAIRTAFGTIVVAVAASELIGPFLTRDLLRRAGEAADRPRAAATRARGPPRPSRCKAVPRPSAAEARGSLRNRQTGTIMDRDQSTEFLSVFVVGALIGVGAALLFAPKPPTRRERIMKELKPYRKKLDKRTAGARKAVGKQAASAADWGEEMVEASRAVVSDMRDEIASMVADARDEIADSVADQLDAARKSLKKSAKRIRS